MNIKKRSFTKVVIFSLIALMAPSLYASTTTVTTSSQEPHEIIGIIGGSLEGVAKGLTNNIVADIVLQKIVGNDNLETGKIKTLLARTTIAFLANKIVFPGIASVYTLFFGNPKYVGTTSKKYSNIAQTATICLMPNYAPWIILKSKLICKKMNPFFNWFKRFKKEPIEKNDIEMDQENLSQQLVKHETNTTDSVKPDSDIVEIKPNKTEVIEQDEIIETEFAEEKQENLQELSVENKNETEFAEEKSTDSKEVTFKDLANKKINEAKKSIQKNVNKSKHRFGNFLAKITKKIPGYFIFGR